ncbi:hypothetical protein FLK61_40370 [Paenalkalicoccus suaedae]|uniref:Uncharacterized protein n=1 Tax=Paenalkalicoccus suaedae TaxID=2592382 RepID=A0A859FJ47_9BACI|nr:hypothetical protein [Paenalkalicoccus suaedae]QKS72862.1 hypothetical protein FLK61_40370 [Paenalkalicoccus suaedae]
MLKKVAVSLSVLAMLVVGCGGEEDISNTDTVNVNNVGENNIEINEDIAETEDEGNNSEETVEENEPVENNEGNESGE